MISEQIKQLIKGYIDNASLSDVLIGEVMSTNPINIKFSNSELVVPNEFLVIPSSLTASEYPIELNVQGELLLAKFFNPKKLMIGDTVIAVKQNGGQKYFILDKLGV